MIPHHELTGPADAPVIVLSNSLGTDLTLWDEQVPALIDRFRVLRYDQRGHGRTPATPGPYDVKLLGEDVLALLDHLGLDRVHFAGVSLGGMTGMWLALNAPDRIGRLTLICTSAQLGPPANWHERAALVRKQGTLAIVDLSLERWFMPALATRRDIVDKFGRMIAFADDEGYAGCCEAIAAQDQLDQLSAITAPTLVIAGEDDPATPPEHSERIASAIGNARLVVVPGAAHLANVEQPATVNWLLRHHLGSA